MMQRLGQSFNSAGIALFARVAWVSERQPWWWLRRREPPTAHSVHTAAAPVAVCSFLQSDRPLALPHLSVTDIRAVNWAALRAAGFQGCVFDKDNTLTGDFGERESGEGGGMQVAGWLLGAGIAQKMLIACPDAAAAAEPYRLEVHPAVRSSLAECQRAFEGKLVLYSNSAGLQQSDPEGEP